MSTFQAKVINEKIASDHALAEVRGMMEGVMTEGTGRSVASPLYSSGGKTGTAQMADGSRGYGARRYQSSFAGYFPAEDPKYSIIVVIRNPRNGYYGASIAGPVFKELADMVYANDMEMEGKKTFKAVNVGGRMPLTLQGSKEASKKVYDRLGINTVNWDTIARGEVDTSTRGVPFMDLKYKEGIVPNVVGMGLMDALYVVENAGFKAHVTGKGRVGIQSLAAGQKLPFGTAINLELK